MSNLNLSYRNFHGIDFPVQVNDIQCHLMISKKWREPGYEGRELEPGEHLLRACRALFTKEEFGVSPWTEAHAHAWCDETFFIILGGASCSKSNDTGLFALLDWITDPLNTVTILGSTSKTALADRSFESVVRYHQILKQHPEFFVPGKLSRTTMAIINDNDDDYGPKTTAKAAIRGVAVAEGSAADAEGNLVGRHDEYVRLIGDELSVMRPAFMEARTNLSIGARKDFKFAGLANPISRFDLACRFSEPLDGWDSVNESTTEWRSRYGLVIHHNAFQSPSITEPDGRRSYPFLVSQEQIDNILREENGNEDAPRVWKMLKGFPLIEATEQTVLSAADLTSFHMTDAPIWDDRGIQRRLVAGCDPASSEGGDHAVIQIGEVGLVREGTVVLAFWDPIYIDIRASSPRPIAYQVVDKLALVCAQYGIPISNVAIDDSGTQATSDIVFVETGVQPIRCEFGGSPSEMPLSATNLRPAKLRFKNQVTEIWALVAELGRSSQLRGFPGVPAQQFCNRKFKVTTGLKQLESKKDYKKRLPGQQSPDEADALALCAMAARQVAGLQSGFNTLPSVDARMGNTNIGCFSRTSLHVNYRKGIDLDRMSGYITRG